MYQRRAGVTRGAVCAIGMIIILPGERTSSFCTLESHRGAL